MKRFFIQIITLVSVIFGLLAFSTNHLPQFISTNTELSKIQINGINLAIEIADSPDKRKKGLSGRETIATNSGMLFVFPKPDYYNFWMKDMRFALDLIWINNGSIVDITKNTSPPSPGQADSSLSIYTPSQIADSVLEVNAGFVAANGIKIGDKIQK